MKTASTIVKIIICGIVIPYLVITLADEAIKFYCKQYDKEDLLLGDIGFKVFGGLIVTWFAETALFYFFCILFALINKKNFPKLNIVLCRTILLVLFTLPMLPISWPILENGYSAKEFGLSLFHGAYYFLFALARLIFFISDQISNYLISKTENSRFIQLEKRV